MPLVVSSDSLDDQMTFFRRLRASLYLDSAYENTRLERYGVALQEVEKAENIGLWNVREK